MIEQYCGGGWWTTGFSFIFVVFLLAICMDERTGERLLWEVFVVGEAGG